MTSLLDDDALADALLAAGDWIRDPDRRTWVAARSVDVTAGLRDRRLSSRLPALVKNGADQRRRDVQLIERQMVLLDDPAHARVKAAFRPVFTPAAMTAYRSRIETMTNTRVAGLTVGPVDLVAALSRPAARESLAWLLAGNIEAGSTIIAAGDVLLSVDMGLVVSDAKYAHARGIVMEWANGCEPGAARARLLREELTTNEIAGNLLLLIGAGTETTANLISSALHRLLVDGEATGAAVAAAVRMHCPVQAVERVAIEPLATPGGRRVEVGDRVLLHLGAATRELARQTSGRTRHLAFGLGAHYCLGARFAMLAVTCAVESFAKRYAAVRPEITHVQWHSGASFRGLAEFVVDLPG